MIYAVYVIKIYICVICFRELYTVNNPLGTYPVVSPEAVSSSLEDLIIYEQQLNIMNQT